MPSPEGILVSNFLSYGILPGEEQEELFAKCTENYLGWSAGERKAKCKIFVKTIVAEGLWGARQLRCRGSVGTDVEAAW